MEGYYLTDKQMRYALNANGSADRGGWCKDATINPSVAHAITVRSASGQQRAGVSNFICPNLPNDFPVEELKRLLEYD